jgi:hypothetical protein
MSQILGTFGLLYFAMLWHILTWRAFWNLWTIYFFNFLILFWAIVNPWILIQQIQGHACVHTHTHTHVSSHCVLQALLMSWIGFPNLFAFLSWRYGCRYWCLIGSGVCICCLSASMKLHWQGCKCKGKKYFWSLVPTPVVCCALTFWYKVPIFEHNCPKG